MMTKFLSLPEAFHNQSTCPICCQNLHFDANVAKEWSERYQTNQTTITFQLDGELSLTADYETGNIRRWSKKRPLQQIYVIGEDSPIDCHYRQNTPMTNIFSTVLGCTSCYQYRRLFQIYLYNEQITYLHLNSEFLAIEKSANLYEIRNNYVREETIFTPFDYFRASKSDGKSCVLPLIPWDLQNPNKTLDRIQNLVIFS